MKPPCSIDRCDRETNSRGLCLKHYQRARADGALPPRVAPLPVYVSATCPCGTVFQVTETRAKAGRGKRCSKACQYKYATRPTGLKYKVVVENRGWMKPGREAPTGADNPSWRGDAVSYKHLHRWVARSKTKPDACEHCQATGLPLQWANKSHEYRRELDDWLALCRACHGRHDRGPARGAATLKYGAKAVQQG
jgi:hypothetical protein